MAYLHPDKLAGVRATVAPPKKRKPKAATKSTASGPGLLANLARHIYEGQVNGRS